MSSRLPGHGSRRVRTIEAAGRTPSCAGRVTSSDGTLDRSLAARPSDEETAREAVRPYRALDPAARLHALAHLLRDMDVLVERAVRIELPQGSVPFVTVEDLIVLEMLWHWAKDVPDIHALIATTAGLDRSYVRETLGSILPAEDTRHAEIADLLRRFGPE